MKGELTAENDTRRDTLADGPLAHTLRNIRSEFLDNPGEIVTNDPAILGLPLSTRPRDFPSRYDRIICKEGGVPQTETDSL